MKIIIHALHLDRGPISDDLGDALGYFAGIEPLHHHRIGATLGRFANHAVDRMLARLLEHRRVLRDLAADDGLEPGRDIADDSA